MEEIPNILIKFPLISLFPLAESRSRWPPPQSEGTIRYLATATTTTSRLSARELPTRSSANWSPTTICHGPRCSCPTSHPPDLRSPSATSIHLLVLGDQESPKFTTSKRNSARKSLKPIIEWLLSSPVSPLQKTSCLWQSARKNMTRTRTVWEYRFTVLPNRKQFPWPLHTSFTLWIILNSTFPTTWDRAVTLVPTRFQDQWLFRGIRQCSTMSGEWAEDS